MANIKIIAPFIMIIALLLLVLTLLLPIYSSILAPAYYSYIGACKQCGIQEAQQAGFVLGGLTITKNDTTEIKIFIPESSVIRHEYCHYAQVKQHRDFNCNAPLFFYLNEIECYLLDKIPFSTIKS